MELKEYIPTDIAAGRLHCSDCKHNDACEHVDSQCSANCIYNGEIWHYTECSNVKKIKSLSDLFGKEVKEVIGCHIGSYKMTIKFTDGYSLTFEPADTCAKVEIDDIVGDPHGMVGNKLFHAEVSSNKNLEPRDRYDTSYRWTFYKFRTIDGYVDIKWYGYSNGYYSEEVLWTIEDADGNQIAWSY